MALSENNNNNNVHGYCFKDTLLISIILHKLIQVFGTKPTKQNLTYENKAKQMARQIKTNEQVKSLKPFE